MVQGTVKWFNAEKDLVLLLKKTVQMYLHTFLKFSLMVSNLWKMVKSDI